MTNDEILQAAKDAGLEFESDQGSTYLVAWREEIELFASIIEKRTIERCAVISWSHYMETCRNRGHGPDVESLRDFCSAAAIRKLGEQ